MQKLTSSKYLVYGLAALALLAAVVAIVVFDVGSSENKPKKPAPTASSPCGNYRDDIHVVINGQTFKAEMPRDPAAFAKGLGGRPCILPDQAMLFSFKQPGQYAFWMKDMKFPIDIIWIGADHRVAAAEIDEKPSTYPDKFVNKKPAQYVLEIKANLSKQLHLGIGTPVQFKNT